MSAPARYPGQTSVRTSGQPPVLGGQPPEPARRLLDWTPATPLDQDLRQNVTWHRECHWL
jgi:hypothetical protein